MVQPFLLESFLSKVNFDGTRYGSRGNLRSVSVSYLVITLLSSCSLSLNVLMVAVNHGSGWDDTDISLWKKNCPKVLQQLKGKSKRSLCLPNCNDTPLRIISLCSSRRSYTTQKMNNIIFCPKRTLDCSVDAQCAQKSLKIRITNLSLKIAVFRPFFLIYFQTLLLFELRFLIFKKAQNNC